MDFDAARLKIISEQYNEGGGIGSLSEKLIHKILKYTVEPDDTFHEVEHNGSVADVKKDNSIFEIQTRSFEKLLPKLDKLLSDCSVTVVHPIAVKKQIYRVNRETGEISGPKKSPSPKTVYDSAYELFKLRRLIGAKGFSVKLFLLSVDEYKSTERKQRYGPSNLIERIPRSLEGVIDLVDKSDYSVFIPDGLPLVFTSADYIKAARSRSRYCYYGARLLVELGLAKRVESSGRAYLYTLT